MRVFHAYNLQMMPGESLNHSGIRKIECLEELGDAVWELDRASQTLTFTGLVRTTEGIGGLVVSSVIHHVTLEIVLPLERMISTLGLDRALRGLGDQGLVFVVPLTLVCIPPLFIILSMIPRRMEQI